MISQAGYYDSVDLADYLADPCKDPSLSTNIVHDLFYETAKHARLRHPRLGGDKPDATPRADIGSAVHELTRGRSDVVMFAPPEFADWKKKAAQEFRDAARADHKIALLDHQRIQVDIAATNAINALAELGTGDFEQTLIWQHPTEGVWCRGRADWLSHGATQIGAYRFPDGVDVDLKTVDSAEASSWLRTNVLPSSQTLDIQMGLRDQGHLALTGRRRGMVWLLQEYEPPYEHAWIIASPMLLEQAHMKIDHAAKLWQQCLASDRWPGYDARVTFAEPGAWAEMDIKMRLGAA